MTTAVRGARVRAAHAAGAATALLALSPAAHAAPDADDPPSPLRAALSAPVAGHLTVASQMLAARRDERRQRLARIAGRLERRIARVRGVRSERPPLRGDSPAALRDRIGGLRRELRAARRERALERVAIPPQLEAIAACESGGDPRAIGGGGLYRGKYQFDFQTWASVGGTGDPAAAPEAEQDMRAALLYARAGAAPWPVCGH
jgi:Transglycosylase-like domain